MELLCYTRIPEEDSIYACRLAYSVHLAYRNGKGHFSPFHHNEGIVYAKAVHNSDGTMTAKSIKRPWLFATGDHKYALAAIRTQSEGESDPESDGCILVWTSDDLIHYRETGLFRLQRSGQIQDIRCTYDRNLRIYRIYWQNENGRWLQGKTTLFTNDSTLVCSEENGIPAIPVETALPNTEDLDHAELAEIKGIQPGNSLVLPDFRGKYLCQKLLVPVCTTVNLSVDRPVSLSELTKTKAVATYSDGTTVTRKIDWENKDTMTKNPVTLRGRIHQEHFDFPFALNHADPCCMYWNNKYYFIATNDADDNHTLYIRCSEKLEDIVNAKEILLLNSETYPDIKGLLWAPEFHIIDNRLYIFHAATDGEFFREESRVMQLKEGGNPICAADWSKPHPVVKKDGTPLCNAGSVISLDMTTFVCQGNVYAVWSQRQFLPVDQGAWLYIAQINEKEPWKLVNDPVCLIKPEYGWENNHTFVVEGPYALIHDKHLMITYSAAAVDATYTVGLLRHTEGTDVMDPNNWRKNNYPIMSSRSVEGQFGTGHNSYMRDENGLTWNFYHARKGIKGPRSSGARRVHFDIDGEPMLDVPEESDLPESLRHVEIKVIKQ